MRKARNLSRTKWPYIKDPGAYQEVNVKGTQNMLELARERGVEHFVFGSSSSVYGTNPNVPWRENGHVLKPISPYAGTKVSGELLGYSPNYDLETGLENFATWYKEAGKDYEEAATA